MDLILGLNKNWMKDMDSMDAGVYLEFCVTLWLISEVSKSNSTSVLSSTFPRNSFMGIRGDASPTQSFLMRIMDPTLLLFEALMT